MKIIVLSMDTEIGEKRRNKLNYDYEWFKSVSGEEIIDRFNFRYNTSEDKKKRIMSVFNSHLKILQKIVDEKLNDVVVCEDDSIKLNDDHQLSKINEICLFGGVLRHPSNWKEDTKWRKEKVDDIIESFDDGMNKIEYDKYRWTQIYAVYYPSWEKANELLKSILESKKKYCHIDIFISKNKLINYLYYPTPFMSSDDGISQVDIPQGIVKDYKILGKKKI